MSQQDNNIELVKKGYAAFSAGDMETVMNLYDDNVEWIQPGGATISGRYHGKGELGTLLSNLGQKMTSLKPLRFFADGDTVVVFSEATIGSEVSHDVEVFDIRDGKVVHAQTYGDTALMERVYGKKQVAAT